MFNLSTVPNSRILGKLIHAPLYNWDSIIAEIDEFISVDKFLEQACEDHFLYFSPGRNTSFDEESFFLGRSVIGLTALDKESGLEFRDDISSQVREWEIQRSVLFSWNQLKEFFEKCSEEISQIDQRESHIWRAVIKKISSQNGEFHVKLYLQCYLDKQ